MSHFNVWTSFLEGARAATGLPGLGAAEQFSHEVIEHASVSCLGFAENVGGLTQCWTGGTQPAVFNVDTPGLVPSSLRFRSVQLI